MRFDPERVNLPPDDFAERLSVQGWQVERWPVGSASFPLSVLAVLALVWVALGPTRLIRLAVAAMGLATLAGASVLTTRRTTPSFRGAFTAHVLAFDRPFEERTARLLIVIRHRPPGSNRLGTTLGFLLALVFGLILTIPEAPVSPRWPPVVGWVWLGLAWLGLLYTRFRPVVSPGEASSTGLAFLAELARTWPRGARSRVGTVLVVSPNLTDLAATLRGRFDDGTPTLALVLDAPERGRELTIAGRGPAAGLVAEAARALWVPHRRAGPWSSASGTFALSRSGIPCVTLSSAGRGQPPDPGSLARLAQLTAEVAMRWGKLAAAPPGPMD